MRRCRGAKEERLRGGSAVLFRLNYMVTQGGQRRHAGNKRGRRKTYCKEGLAQTVGEGDEYGTESDLGQIVFAKTSQCFALTCTMGGRLLGDHESKFMQKKRH